MGGQKVTNVWPQLWVSKKEQQHFKSLWAKTFALSDTGLLAPAR